MSQSCADNLPLPNPALEHAAEPTGRLAQLRTQAADMRQQNQSLEWSNLDLRIRASHVEERLRAPQYQLADRLRRASRRIPGLRRVVEPVIRAAWYVFGRRPHTPAPAAAMHETTRIAAAVSGNAESGETDSRRIRLVETQLQEIAHAGRRIHLENQCLTARLADLEGRLGQRRYRIADGLFDLTVRFPGIRRAAEPVARIAWLTGRRLRQLVSP